MSAHVRYMAVIWAVIAIKRTVAVTLGVNSMIEDVHTLGYLARALCYA